MSFENPSPFRGFSVYVFGVRANLFAALSALKFRLFMRQQIPFLQPLTKKFALQIADHRRFYTLRFVAPWRPISWLSKAPKRSNCDRFNRKKNLQKAERRCASQLVMSFGRGRTEQVFGTGKLGSWIPATETNFFTASRFCRYITNTTKLYQNLSEQIKK